MLLKERIIIDTDLALEVITDIFKRLEYKETL